MEQLSLVPTIVRDAGIDFVNRLSRQTYRLLAIPALVSRGAIEIAECILQKATSVHHVWLIDWSRRRQKALFVKRAVVAPAWREVGAVIFDTVVDCVYGLPNQLHCARPMSAFVRRGVIQCILRLLQI